MSYMRRRFDQSVSFIAKKMSDSEQEDVFDQGGYDSDKDKEWLPSENKKKQGIQSLRL